jgi:hypothetical protein
MRRKSADWKSTGVLACCQQIDTLNHSLQIVLGWTIEQADLHIHHNNCIHGLISQFDQTPFED